MRRAAPAVAAWVAVEYRISPIFASLRYTLKGPDDKVTIIDTQRDLTARQGVHTRCPCTYSKVIGRYHSCEAHKGYLWPRDMAINEHQLVESSIGEKLYALAFMLCPCSSRRAAASPARRGGGTRCHLTMCSSEARAELILAWLAKCSELFLLHAANCVDGVQSCEDEGT